MTRRLLGSFVVQHSPGGRTEGYPETSVRVHVDDRDKAAEGQAQGEGGGADEGETRRCWRCWRS